MSARVHAAEAWQNAGLWIVAGFAGLCFISMVWAGATILGLTSAEARADRVVRDIAWAMILAPFAGLFLVSLLTEADEADFVKEDDEAEEHEKEE